LILGLNPQLSVDLFTVCGRTLSSGTGDRCEFAGISCNVLISIVFLVAWQVRINAATYYLKINNQ